ELEFPDGPIRRLTEVEGLHPYSATISPDGGEVYYTRRGGVEGLRRKDLKTRALLEIAAAQFGECSLSHEGEWIVTAYKPRPHGRHRVHGLAARAAPPGLEHTEDHDHRRVQRLAHHAQPCRLGDPVRHEPPRRRPADGRRRDRAPPHDLLPAQQQWRQPVEEVALRARGGLGRGARGAQGGAELDGDADRHGLRTAVDASASLVQPRRKARGLHLRRVRAP